MPPAHRPPSCPPEPDVGRSLRHSVDESLPVEEGRRLGQWELVTVVGKPIDSGHYPVTLLVGRSGGEGQSKCIPLDFNWPGMERPLALPKAPPPTRGPSGPSHMHARADPGRAALQPNIVSANSFRSERHGSLVVGLLTGSLTLRRTAEPTLYPFGQSSVDPAVPWGKWPVAALEGCPTASPLHLLVFRDRLELISGCLGISWLLDQIVNGLLLSMTEVPAPAASA